MRATLFKNLNFQEGFFRVIALCVPMALTSKFQSKPSSLTSRLKWLWGNNSHSNAPLLKGKHLLYLSLFIFYIACVVFICFAGQAPAGLQVAPGQIARNRLISQVSFSYESKILRKKLIEERSLKVPPCYKLNLEAYQTFRTQILTLNQSLIEWEQSTGLIPFDRKLQSLENFVKNFNNKGSLRIHPEDVQILLQLEPDTRSYIIEEGLLCLREILSNGVIDPQQLGYDPSQQSFISIQVEGQKTPQQVQSTEDAYLLLRRYLKVLEVDPNIHGALFRIFKNGIQPNLLFDPSQREQKLTQLASNIPPFVVHIEPGQVLLESGRMILPEDYERVSAYRQALRDHDDFNYGFSSVLIDNLLLTFILLVAALVHIRLSLPNIHQSWRKLLLCAFVLLFHLIFIRGLFIIGDLFLASSPIGIVAMLSYLAPVALGPMILAIMLDGGAAILLALLASALTVLMHGQNIEIFILYLISSFVGIALTSGAKVRAKVVRAGALAGLTSAIAAAALGIDELPLNLLLGQCAVALGTGLLTGVIIIGLLPILENIFKITTDITLLELTDFNHPLLRRLQMIAPGTYHHSLMVANLAERAAAEIGANSLTCRAAALFHDIGKIVKPEYFIENQQEAMNPHQLRAPSMSALVIKHHVKEGVQIARESKLPDVVVDVIEQHHGTTLIQYFYSKAIQQSRQNQDTPHPNIEIDEATYRYDGPKPKFKESAIIFLADTIEAASRSLKKTSPQHIDDLINKIVEERLADQQLVDCPLTFKELGELKKSFAFTLLNMLHSRVEYPEKEKH